MKTESEKHRCKLCLLTVPRVLYFFSFFFSCKRQMIKSYTTCPHHSELLKVMETKTLQWYKAILIDVVNVKQVVPIQMLTEIKKHI